MSRTDNERRLYEALTRCIPFVTGREAREAFNQAESLLHELRDEADDLCGQCGHRKSTHYTYADDSSCSYIHFGALIDNRCDCARFTA